MKKYKTFVYFLLLVLVWSFFFGAFKFFTWTFFQKDFDIKLEQIAGALSLGGVFAYLVGGIFSTIFPKRGILFVVSIFSILLLFALYELHFPSQLGILLIISLIGILFSFWSITKNSLIFVEVNKTGRTDTFINGAAGIIFIISLLGGSVIGPKIFEIFGKIGSIYIFIPILLSLIFSYFIVYSEAEDKLVHEKVSIKGIELFKDLFNKYMTNAIDIFKTYWMILICVGILWGISTIIAQQAIEFSIEKFNKTNSEVVYIFLYSGVGAIIGNAISMFIKNNRWFYYSMFVYIFALLVMLFPILAKTYDITIILAILIAIFFGAASNLLDAYYFYEIGKIGKKEHGSGIYGLIMSLLIAVLMFSVSYVSPILGRSALFMILSFLIATTGILVRLNLKKLNIKL